MFRDHPKEMNTLGKGSEACVLMGKAARLSSAGQTTQVQNLSKRNHEESLKLYHAVPYPFTKHLYKKMPLFLWQSIKSKMLCSQEIT